MAVVRNLSQGARDREQATHESHKGSNHYEMVNFDNNQVPATVTEPYQDLNSDLLQAPSSMPSSASIVREKPQATVHTRPLIPRASNANTFTLSEPTCRGDKKERRKTKSSA